MALVLPNHYDIRIEPNFGDLTFNGKTIIYLQANESVKSITLNAVDLTVTSCNVITEKETKDAKIQVDPNKEEMTLTLPLKYSGEFKIEFNYIGKIQENLKGLYKTNYKVGEKIFTGAITQFEQEDARRMFPCFDEPVMKATFDLEVIVDNNLTTLSNMPIKIEEKIEDDKKRVVFERTPKMSTYLLFLGIAQFESIKDVLDSIEVKVITHPGLTKFGKEGLEFGKKALDFCQKYFKIPYPLPKMDLICTPDFAAGAMENWGAISFREDLLLTFPGSTSKINEMANKIVISHEISHQWFGNLVSPSLWKYIWLNESFADFFGTKTVEFHEPNLHVWDYYVGSQTSEALLADAYIETVPIEIKGEDKASYNIKTIPIIYSKGGSIIRMVNDFIGDKNFQIGLQKYLTKHSYNVASSDDLWSALEDASKQPISKLMKTWVLQPGYPLLTVSRSGNSLSFSQERFTYLENSDTTLWLVPITVLFFTEDGKTFKKSFLLDNKESSFDIEKNFTSFKVNHEHTGFYRVKYSPEDSKILGSFIAHEQLSTLDSWNLVNDTYALLISGKVKLDYYLQFVVNYSSPKLHSSIRSISTQLMNLFLLCPEGKNKQKITQVGITFHESYLDKIQFLPQANEPFENTVSRNLLIKNAGFIGSQKAIDFCLQKFKDLQQDKSVPPDILEAVLAIGARQTNDLTWFLDQLVNAKNEVEIINFGNALAEFSNAQVVRQILDEIIFSKIPMRNLAYAIQRLCNNPFFISDNKIWKFFIANLDNIGKVNEFLQPYIINSIVTNPAVDDATRLDMEKFFTDYNKVNAVPKMTTEKSFETVAINISVKKSLDISKKKK